MRKLVVVLALALAACVPVYVPSSGPAPTLAPKHMPWGKRSDGIQDEMRRRMVIERMRDTLAPERQRPWRWNGRSL